MLIGLVSLGDDSIPLFVVWWMEAGLVIASLVLFLIVFSLV